MTTRSSAALVAGVVLLPMAASAGAVTLFGLVDTGELFVSQDAGVTWTVRSTLPVRDAVGLLRGGSGGELYLVSRSGTAYLSSDGGMSWSAVGSVPASDVVSLDLATGPSAPLLVLGRTGTAWASSDGGVLFTAVGTLAASDQVSLTHDGGGGIYALTATGTVRESLDGGISWSTRGSLPVSDAVEIASLDTQLMVLTGAGDVWRSTDGGAGWAAVGTLAQVHMSSMIRGEGGLLLASTREGEVATSADDGVTWAWVGTINQMSVVALATDLPPTGVDVSPPPAGGLTLSCPRPNPRRGPDGSWFDLTLPAPATVRFTLYDVRGRRLADRGPERFSSGGRHSVYWNPAVAAAGVHYVRVTTESGDAAGTRWVLIR